MIPRINLSITGLLMFLVLSGCASMPRERPDSRQPICEALIGPIRYTSDPSVRNTSRRFAGVDLAASLAERNRVGKNLKCPQYR